jgi:drug/metabolite transporter (DMT)-like permease
LNADIRKQQLDRQALGLVLGCCLIWGFGQVAAKLALVQWPPLWQAGLRSAVALLLLLTWCAWRGIGLRGRDGTLGAGLLAGALFALEFALIFSGLQYTGASRMSVWIYLAPFFVAVGMPFIAKEETLKLRQLAGLGLAFCGATTAVAEGWGQEATAAAGPQWWGDAMGVGAALCWALTTLVVRGSALSTASAEKTLAYQLAFSGFALCLWAALSGQALPPPGTWQAGPLLALLFQGTVVSFASYLTWFWLVRHYPATRLSAATLLTPVAGLAAGVLVLGEPLSARLLLALAAVCAGLWLVNRR